MNAVLRLLEFILRLNLLLNEGLAKERMMTM